MPYRTSDPLPFYVSSPTRLAYRPKNPSWYKMAVETPALVSAFQPAGRVGWGGEANGIVMLFKDTF